MDFGMPVGERIGPHPVAIGPLRRKLFPRDDHMARRVGLRTLQQLPERTMIHDLKLSKVHSAVCISRKIFLSFIKILRHPAFVRLRIQMKGQGPPLQVIQLGDAILLFLFLLRGESGRVIFLWCCRQFKLRLKRLKLRPKPRRVVSDPPQLRHLSAEFVNLSRLPPQSLQFVVSGLDAFRSCLAGFLHLPNLRDEALVLRAEVRHLFRFNDDRGGGRHRAHTHGDR